MLAPVKLTNQQAISHVLKCTIPCGEDDKIRHVIIIFKSYVSLHFGLVLFCSLQQCALSVGIYYHKGLIKSTLVMQKTKESVIKMEMSLMVPVKTNEAG